jgi:selenocysteine-specific elongation factor
METNTGRMSDIISEKGGLVFGTAGHIDHGKTTLVRALTGIDTDRLAEEKKRGISIELGFADLLLPSGQRIAIVDVPGHERFIKNMLAGTGGIDAVLMIVAADEGLKPQTREHFDICRLLGIPDGIVVLTKTDAASAEQTDRMKSEVRQFCAGSFLDKAACVPVSAYTGRGLDVLIAEMEALTRHRKPRPTSSFARLPVDRSFTMQGFGTVVTGTLQGGSLKPGEMVEIHPLREQFRIRGLQVHRSPVQEAFAGQRTAVNLAGVEAAQIQRGAVLTTPNTLASTNIFDALVDWLEPKHALRARQALRLYAGCVESMADVRLIENLDNRRTLTRISSREPLLLLPGDRFVLRNSMTTIGGGGVIDPAPPIRANREKTRERLRKLMEADDDERLRLLVDESTQGRKIANLTKLTGWAPNKIRAMAKEDAALHLAEAEQRVMSTVWLKQKREQVIAWLENYHAVHPGSGGAGMHQIRSALLSGIETSITDEILRSMPEIRITGDTLSLAGHAVKLNPQETAARDALERLYRGAGFQPPPLAQALASVGVQAASARAQLEALVKAKKLVKVSAEFIFHAEVVDHVKRSLAAHKGKRFTVPEFKEWTGVSRKHAIPLLEFLDRERVTRREGDTRVVL